MFRSMAQRRRSIRLPLILYHHAPDLFIRNANSGLNLCRVEGAPYGTPTPTEPIVQFSRNGLFIHWLVFSPIARNSSLLKSILGLLIG
jgi:hypothetical protein